MNSKSLILGLLVFLFIGSTKAATDNNTIESRVENLSFFISVEMNSTVKKYIKSYFVNEKDARELLDRSHLYFPIIEDVLQANNLPDDIKYLTVIESELREHVKSQARAVGMWQLMSNTADYYGVRVDSQVDERKNAYTSTSGAVIYLLDLYKQFDDWSLALLAYNCGPTHLRKIIRETGSKDTQVLLKHLPKETEIYLDKLLAAKYFFKHYSDHNLIYVPPSPKDYVTTTLQIGNQETSFQEISENFGVEMSDLYRLNNHIKDQNHIAKTTIVVPYYRGNNQSYEIVHHKLGGGQRLEDVASFMNISPNFLKLWNPGEIIPGQEIMLYMPTQLRDKFDSKFQISVATIESRDEISEISRATTVPTLAEKSPKRTAPKTEYVVQKHESLEDIAWLFDMAIEDLESINPNLDFRPGATIYVYQK